MLAVNRCPCKDNNISGYLADAAAPATVSLVGVNQIGAIAQLSVLGMNLV